MRSLPLLLMLIIANSPNLYSQQNIQRFEIGTQTTYLRTERAYSRLNDNPDQWGLGPAVTINLNKRFAVDSCFTAFLGRHDAPTVVAGGRLIEGLAGMKATIHARKFGLFAKARPGFVNWSKVITSIGPASDKTSGRTYFALDFGGGIDFYASQRFVVRAEYGDMMIRLNQPTFGFSGFRHNLQASTTVAYRFGKNLGTEASSSKIGAHRFLDRGNLALISAALLSRTADSITTQRGIADCRRLGQPRCSYVEANPLARPFVKYGWAGQIGFEALSQSTSIFVQYVVHRTGHHRIERLLPVATAITSSIAAHSNLQGR